MVDDARKYCEEWSQPELFYVYLMCQEYDGMTEVLCRQVSPDARLESGQDPTEWTPTPKTKGFSGAELDQLRCIMAPIADSLSKAATTCPPHLWVPMPQHDGVFYCQQCLETRRVDLNEVQ